LSKKNSLNRFIYHISIAIGTVVLLSGLNSCKPDLHKEYLNEKKQVVNEVWYTKHQIKSRTVFLTNDKSKYTIISYYEDGTLMDSATYVNQAIDGLRIYHDQPNDLTFIENHKNGTLNGPHKAVYANGVANFEGFRKNGFMVGEWEFHYPEGIPITYEFYDSTGRIIYLRKYDSNSNPLSTEGDGLISVVKLNSSNEKMLKFEVVASIPPGCESSLEIKNMTNSIHQSILKDVRSIIEVDKRFSQETELEFSLSLKETASGRIQVFEKKLTITPNK